MQRWVSISIGSAVVAIAVAVSLKTFHATGAPAEGKVLPGNHRGDDAGALPIASAAAASTGVEGRLARVDSGFDPASPKVVEGIAPPALPATAPRQVRFGVVLISYADAEQELAPGARPSKRSRADARLLAERLASTAAQDFHAAVQQGDPGSSDDVGTVKIGILEPLAEYVLFSLPVDQVGGPVETPRGYWIVKRLE